MSKNADITRIYREKMLADPYRPTYHFAAPDGNAYPGDPNGAFFADGCYHLMYLYKSGITGGYHWGHMSSLDLLHWRQHPDALTTHNGDGGCFSGGAFVDDDGTAYLSFWKFKSVDGSDKGGIALAKSRPPYDVWERVEPIAFEEGGIVWGVAEITVDGKVEHIACADPSNIWKRGGYYYMQTGNKPVLDAYGRKDDSDPHYRGDWCDLLRSKDLKKWEFVKRFYNNPHYDNDYPDATEDDMCPTLLPLPDKKSGGKLTDIYLQTFISHNKGGQYYIGELDNESFTVKSHGRFTWKDNALFAPEAMLDDKNRHICWFWYLDNIKGEYAANEWSGVYSFPRVFWYDNGLRMAPAEELDHICYNEQQISVGELNGKRLLPVKNGESFRIRASVEPGRATKVSFSVRAAENGADHADITVDLEEGKLLLETSRVLGDDRAICEEAPFALAAGEALTFDIFVDRSIIEVYANERQAICRRFYPQEPDKATNVYAISDGADFGTVTAYEVMPTNMY